MEENLPQLCIICLRSNISSSEVSWLQFLIPEETPALASNLCSIFLLRNLLKVPGKKCEEWMKTTFGIDPGNWCGLCVSCSKHVLKAYMLNQKVLSLERKIQLIRNKLENKLESSFCVKNQEVEVDEDEGTFGVIDVHRLIREYFYDVLQINEKSEVAGRNQAFEVLPSEKVVCSDEDGYYNSPISQFNDEDDYRDPLCISDSDDVCVKQETAHSHQLQIDGGTSLLLHNDDTSQSMEAGNVTFVKKSGGNKYGCDMCELSYKYISCLEVHKKIKHYGGAASCPFCGVTLNSSVNLRYHWSYKHCKRYPGKAQSKRKVTLRRKSAKTKCKSAATKDVKPGTEGNVNSDDDICAPPTKQRIPAEMPQSTRKSKLEEIIECEKCDFVCNTKIKLADHMKVHQVHDKFESVSEAKVKCKLCGQVIGSASQSMFLHMRKFHLEEMGVQHYQCKVCNMGFHCPNSLKQHLRTHTNVPKPRKPGYKCDICGAERVNEDILIKHRRKHHGIGRVRLECKHCEGTFAHYPSLMTHIRTFHPEHARPIQHKSGTRITPQQQPKRRYLKCKVCGELILHFKLMAQHLKTKHPEEYKHKCEFCDNTFRSKQLLKIHKNAKHSSKKHACPYCKVELSYASNMFNHWKHHCKEYQRTHLIQ